MSDSSAAPNKWLVTLSISFGTLMGAIDSSIVNVALPQIRGAVGATVQEITWISTGYAMALVVVMPLTAFLGRLFGQKRVYMVCLAVFVVGSALCGTASSLGTLVAYRFLQGLGAGALQPTQQAILRQTFPPKEQGMAMAIFAVAVMLGPAVGPTLGGVIVDNWHWSWIFFINLPIGVVGFAMVWLFLHDDPELRAKNQALAEQQRRHVDWLGIALLSLGLCALEYFLEEGARQDWLESRLIAGCLLVSVFALVGFVLRELTAPAPAVNLRLFKDPVFTAGTSVGALMMAMLMASMFLLPIFMQELLGFTATQSGIALMPRVLVMLVAMPIVGRLYNLVEPRLIVLVGVVLFAIGAWDMSHLTLQSGSADIVFAISIQGVGFACLFVPLTTLALANVPRHKMPDATGLNSLLRQMGGAIGLAIFATMLSNGAVVARSAIAAHVTETSPLVQQRLAAVAGGLAARGADPVTAKSLAIASLYGAAVKQSLVLSFDKLFLLAGILFVAAIPLLWFLKIDRRQLTAEIHPE